MAEALYMDNCYLKHFDAEVKEVNEDKFIVLDRTAFYPSSGGQPHDTGFMKANGEEYRVLYTGKFSGEISHQVDKPGLKAGDKVSCEIDWPRRHLFMRYHTAAHMLSGVIHKETSAEITGNQIAEDKTRIDFDLENFDAEKIKEYVKKSNDIIKKALPVALKNLPREEAFQIPSLVKLKMALPESIKIIRIVDIEGFDQQACAGTHVKNTSEIGEIELIKTENKGKNNRRVYFVLR